MTPPQSVRELRLRPRHLAFLAMAAAISFAHSADAALVLNYTFEEGAGTATEDLAAGDNNGTLTNGATFSSATPNSSGFSLSVDGSNDFVSVANQGALLQAASGFTLAAWVNLDTFANSGSFENIIFISNANSLTQARAALQIGSGGQFAVAGRRVDGDSFSRYISAASLLQTGTWAHIAATVDFSGGTPAVVLYLNGAAVGIVATSGGFTSGMSISNTASLVANIGARDAGSEQADGLIDDVRVYDSVLSAGEIAALVTVVPEPSSYALIAGSLALGAVTVRRRRA